MVIFEGKNIFDFWKKRHDEKRVHQRDGLIRFFIGSISLLRQGADEINVVFLTL